MYFLNWTTPFPNWTTLFPNWTIFYLNWTTVVLNWTRTRFNIFNRFNRLTELDLKAFVCWEDEDTYANRPPGILPGKPICFFRLFLKFRRKENESYLTPSWLLDDEQLSVVTAGNDMLAQTCEYGKYS